MSDNNVILIIGIAVVIFLIMNLNKKNAKKYYNNNLNNYTEHFDTAPSSAPAPAPSSAPAPAPSSARAPAFVYDPKNFKALDGKDDTYKPFTSSIDFIAQAGQGFNLGVDSKDPNLQKYFSQAPPQKTPIISDDLLPKKSENWFETPSVGSKIDDANLLADALFKLGVDTIGNTKKNPSYDIRGTIANPKFPISPWNNSSYEPDNNLRSLC
jgi:hypothetical protein